MKKASTRLLEQETQTPSPAPDLIPAESSTENLHWDWYSKRGHFTSKHAHRDTRTYQSDGQFVQIQERVGEEWQAATGGCIAASPPFAF